MKITPKRKHAVIRRGVRADVEKENTSGIIDPRSDHPTTWQGIVVVVADDFDEPVLAGERVCFDPMLSREVRVDGETLVVVHQDDILASLGTCTAPH